ICLIDVRFLHDYNERELSVQYFRIIKMIFGGKNENNRFFYSLLVPFCSKSLSSLSSVTLTLLTLKTEKIKKETLLPTIIPNTKLSIKPLSKTIYTNFQTR
ncbi:MAG: hypothetical protein IIV63_06295, partial [Clostridia bacterium]|nr:hypothetical protein [Clostridia bacterium]